MAIQPVLARKEAIDGIDHVVVRSRTDLDDDDPGRGMRDEDRQQPVDRLDIGDERGARAGEVRQPAAGSGPDRDLDGVYGKMLRSASRMRPRPPMAGADS